MAFLPITLLVFLLSFSSTPSTSATAEGTKTAYQILQEYDFPVGLLPKGVTNYTIDSSTGKFTVSFDGTCSFSIDSYELEYKSTITGVLSEDKLSSLSGIKVKVLFFWLSIVELVRDGDEIEFSVGIASADFAVSNFAESPTCGCGFDCVTAGDENNGKFDRLVSYFFE